MAKARDRIEDVRSPYVKRAIEDEELRENLRSAFATARGVYDELLGQPRRDAVWRRGLRATRRSRTSSARRSRTCATQPTAIQGHHDRKGRNSTLLLAGIAIGILFNPLTGPETRRWLKDKIFGEDEEFGYGSSRQRSS